MKYLFEPKSIAVIGASRDERSVGFGILKNLVHGGFYDSPYCAPFVGKVYAINPKADEILGNKCYKSILDIEDKVDLAVVAVPAKIVPIVIKQCIKKKVGGVIIISAGFAEFNKQGKIMQDKIVSDLRKAKIPLVGPNCLGIINTANHMNASFAPTMPPGGSVGFISQSGALADSIIDWAVEEKYGFSKIISYGNKADLKIYDFIEYLDHDKETKAITLYIEGIDDGKKFMKIAKKCRKPIIALKAGKTGTGAKAISSHTGSLAGAYETYLAAFKQSNIIVAETVEELFDIAKAVANQPFTKDGIGIITNGGGCGVLCADYCEDFGLDVVELKEETLKRLDKSGMHPAYSRRNPLDLVGDALSERYESAINILLEEKYVNGLIVIQTLQTMTDPVANAKVIVEAQKKFPEKPIICVYMGGKFSKPCMKILEENGIPDYNDLRKAARAMRVLVKE